MIDSSTTGPMSPNLNIRDKACTSTFQNTNNSSTGSNNNSGTN